MFDSGGEHASEGKIVSLNVSLERDGGVVALVNVVEEVEGVEGVFPFTGF